MDTKTALITGGTRGLGETLAGFLWNQGWRVVVTARGSDSLPGDVTDPAHRRALARSVGPRLDLLVNNASELGTIRPLEDASADEIRRVLEVNVVAPLALVRETLPALRAARGLVVNVSSDAAVAGYEGWGVYGASKAGLDLVSRTLASELRPDGVGVVSVDPGDMRTAMHQQAFSSEDISDRPLPDVTIPFWAWLLGREPLEVSGMRYRAQDERWELAA